MVLVIEELQSKNCECEGRALDGAYSDGRKGIARNRRLYVGLQYNIDMWLWLFAGVEDVNVWRK